MKVSILTVKEGRKLKGVGERKKMLMTSVYFFPSNVFKSFFVTFIKILD